jgi:hypothetical protein
MHRQHDERDSAGRPAGGATRHTEVPAKHAPEENRSDILDAAAILHLQRNAGNASTGAVLAGEAVRSLVLKVINSRGGAPLEPSTRAEMESFFGQDFGAVRIHTGAEATESARNVHAMAYTLGNQIVFADGNYAPKTLAGKRMLGHELAHVVQQSSGTADGTANAAAFHVSERSDPSEQAAERAAQQITEVTHVSGDGSTVQPSGACHAVTLQRRPEDSPSNESEIGRRLDDGLREGGKAVAEGVTEELLKSLGLFELAETLNAMSLIEVLAMPAKMYLYTLVSAGHTILNRGEIEGVKWTINAADTLDRKGELRLLNRELLKAEAWKYHPPSTLTSDRVHGILIERGRVEGVTAASDVICRLMDDTHSLWNEIVLGLDSPDPRVRHMNAERYRSLIKLAGVPGGYVTVLGRLQHVVFHNFYKENLPIILRILEPTK